MHGSIGLHSALAIKRQRRLREQARKRAAERRMSTRTDSMDSMEHLPTKHHPKQTPESYHATSIGMLHIGVCFLVLGLFLIGSGLLPDDVMTWRSIGWFNELVITGIFVAALGIFLIILNRIVSRKEEDELQDYVQRQLTRSRSGHRLERDVETGCLTTKHHKRALEMKREQKEQETINLAAVHSPHNRNAPQTILNGEIPLEKIMEEDVVVEKDDIKLELRETMSTTTTASLSPGTPSETRELLVNGRQYSFNSRQY